MVSHALDTAIYTKLVRLNNININLINTPRPDYTKSLTSDNPMTNNSIGIPISTQFPN